MHSSTSSPYFSIIILYWNAQEYLARCLQALENQSYKDFEVILLDNGSQQPLDTTSLTQFSLPDLQVLTQKENLGFASGNNHAAQYAKGEYIIFLNADAFPNPDWLAQIYDATKRHPNSFFASRLTMANEPDKLDGEWNIYHTSGLVWRKSHNQPIIQAFPVEKEVFSACAAASIYPRRVFEELGGFDGDFFSYVEDIDLDFRLQLQGISCIYLPQAIVYHVGSGSTAKRSDFSLYYGHRNLIWAFVKNMPGFLFWLLLPLHILMNILYIFASIFMKKGRLLIKAKVDAIKGLPVIIQKRKVVQKNRKVSVWQIARLLDWNPFSPLIKLTFSK